MKDFQTIQNLLIKEGEPMGLDKELKNKEGKVYSYYIEQRQQ